MPHHPPHTPDDAAQRPPAATAGDTLGVLDLGELLAAARRQYKAVLLCVLFAISAGLLYLMSADPEYTARARVLIDPGNTTIGEDDPRTTALGLDPGLVESKLELVRSEEVLNRVVDTLDLTNRPEFTEKTPSPIGRLRSLVGGLIDLVRGSSGSGDAPDADYLTRRRAVGTLYENLTVGRVGQTYILELRYSAPSPAIAAEVANAVAEAFISDQLEARFDAARRTGDWMQQRIEELKERSLETDHAVQKFRAEHGLITAEGQLVGDQRLAELNSQLMLAGVERAKAEAKYRRIRTILDTGDMDAAVSESLSSSVITDLRAKYLAAAKRESELADRLGPQHDRVVDLREEMAEYEQQIFGEIGRIAQSYKSDLDIAHSREETLQQSLDALVGSAAEANETMVTLRVLEREAETTRALYESFLQRYQQVIQQQSFPMAEARIVAEAVPPLSPSGPRKAMTLVLFVMAGGAAGVAFGAVRELREHGFRSGAQIRDELGLEYLGALPIIHASVDAPRVSAGGEDDVAPRSPRLIGEDGAILRHVLHEPASLYSETLRSAKVAADLRLIDKTPKIIGVVSVLPEEGKSTVAKNLASLLAQHGGRTLLMDGDIRNPALSRAVAPNAKAGLLEALERETDLKDLYLLERDSKLVLLPTVIRGRVSQSALLLSSSRMKTVLDEASGYFDYIVVDLPPLGPLVDVRAAAHLIDAFLMVVDWGRTPRKLVRSTLASETAVLDKCLGAVLNNVDMRRQHLYDESQARTYYDHHYFDRRTDRKEAV